MVELREHAGLAEAGLRAELAVARVEAEQRESALRVELDLAQAQVRDLQQRLLGRKSEGGKGASELQRGPGGEPARPGQRRGGPGHGRKMLAHLPERIETIELASPQCPACGERLSEFPGTEDSECQRRCKSAAICQRGSVFAQHWSVAAYGGVEAGSAPGGALLSSVTTLLSFSASFVGQNGASGSKSGIGPSGAS